MPMTALAAWCWPVVIRRFVLRHRTTLIQHQTGGLVFKFCRKILRCLAIEHLSGSAIGRSSILVSKEPVQAGSLQRSVNCALSLRSKAFHATQPCR